MKKRALLAYILLFILLFPGCEKKDVNKVVEYDIEGIKYNGSYVAESSDFKVFDFVFLYYINSSSYKTESLKNAHLFSLSYFLARESNPLTDKEREDIIRLCDELTKDNAELYLNMGFVSVLQYKLFLLMENTINKHKAKVFETYEMKEEDLRSYYSGNEMKYKKVALQILYYSVKDENGYQLSAEIITEKKNKALAYIKEIKTSAEMDDLIQEESEDPAVVETGGKMSFVLGEYTKQDEIFSFASDPGTKAGDMTVIVDEYGIYLVRLESLENYDNSDDIKDKVRTDFRNKKFNDEIKALAKEDKYKLTNINEELIDSISDSYTIEEIYLQRMISFTVLFFSMFTRSKERKMVDVISRLDFQKEATNILVVLQEEGNACSFYAFSKINRKWTRKIFTTGYVGRNGIINEGKKEGDGHTPAGIYTFGKCFGIKDDPGNVPLGYTKLTNEDYWDSNPESNTYNQWVKASDLPAGFNKSKYEHLITYKGSYEYVASINYNVNPVVKGKGSAIFLHCIRNGSTATAGCVAIPEADMLNALKMIDENTYIIICRSLNDFYKLVQ